MTRTGISAILLSSLLLAGPGAVHADTHLIERVPTASERAGEREELRDRPDLGARERLRLGDWRSGQSGAIIDITGRGRDLGHAIARVLKGKGVVRFSGRAEYLEVSAQKRLIDRFISAQVTASPEEEARTGKKILWDLRTNGLKTQYDAGLKAGLEPRIAFAVSLTAQFSADGLTSSWKKPLASETERAEFRDLLVGVEQDLRATRKGLAKRTIGFGKTRFGFGPEVRAAEDALRVIASVKALLDNEAAAPRGTAPAEARGGLADRAPEGEVAPSWRRIAKVLARPDSGKGIALYTNYRQADRVAAQEYVIGKFFDGELATVPARGDAHGILEARVELKADYARGVDGGLEPRFALAMALGAVHDKFPDVTLWSKALPFRGNHESFAWYLESIGQDLEKLTNDPKLARKLGAGDGKLLERARAALDFVRQSAPEAPPASK